MTIHFAKEDKAKFHIARLKKNGQNFEIHIDPDKAMDFKQGKQVPIADILLSYDIFKDVKKGERAANLKQIFGTEDVEKIAAIILKEGEVELTAEYLRKFTEKMRKELINMIHENVIDAKTKLPIPVDVIERALQEAKVNVNINRSLKDNFDEAINKLRPILPIKIETKKLLFKIYPPHSMKAIGLIKRYAKIISENWNENSVLTVEVEVTAGKYADLISELSKLTQGNLDVKDLTE
ncbi:MAG: ribosome assembly factor SBDS [Candidatus Woesearchaeota archaeon]